MFKGLIIFVLVFAEIVLAGQDCPKGSRGELVYYKYYSLSYRSDLKIPEWTCYNLTRGMAHGQAQRDGLIFKDDPRIKSAHAYEYNGKGYDRGHMVPADDMSFDLLAMSESFYMTNVAPQTPGMNRGIWRKVEDRMRKLADDYGEITVVTGPVLDKLLNRMPGTSISIPNSFFKVAFYYEGGTRKMEAYVVPNRESQASIATFKPGTQVSLFSSGISMELKKYLSNNATIEVLTGLDL